MRVGTRWWLWGIGVPLLYVVHRLLVGRVLGYRRFRDRLLLWLPLFGVLIRKTKAIDEVFS